MDRNTLSLRDLPTTLQQRLEQLSLPEQQRALLSHAVGVPADERRNLLGIFISPGSGPVRLLPVADISTMKTTV